MTFEPTKGQAAALDMIEALVGEDDPAYAVLTGYAGTGKTTLLQVVAEAHGSPLILTPTGKAALRVQEATGLDASTVHRWLYRPNEDRKTGEVRWQKRPLDDVDLPANRLIVVDEASMVGEELWADIWWLASAIGCKVLLVGDRFQLGPVTKENTRPFNALRDLKAARRADLTEVVRQALDSPIIRASMLIRAGESETLEALTEVLDAVQRPRLVEAFLALAPSRALIAHRNQTRHDLNLEVRKVLGHHPTVLRPGEPLLVLFNNYQVDRFNGEVVCFDKWVEAPGEPVPVRDRYKNLSMMVGYGLARVDGAEVILSQDEVFGQTGAMPMTTLARAARDHAVQKWKYDRKLAPPYLNANLGYCLTAHKAQGSEFDDVMVVVEGSVGWGSGGMYGLEGRRHLYTAITRAKKRVQICFL